MSDGAVDSAAPEPRGAAMRAALRRVAAGEPLAREEMAGVMREIVAGACDPAQIGALLMALSLRGESVDEIVGAVEVMREAVVRVPTSRAGLLDTCGTGGSGVARRNVSTAVAIAVAACGVPVAKHGNRAASSRCGSADVLAALGVDVSAPPERVGRSIDEVGIGFLFAPALHPAMRHAAPVRRALGVRTIFNLIGPLSNPAGAPRQMLGVFDPARCRDLALALGRLGSEHVLVVHGFRAGVPAAAGSPPGIDDASCEGETLVVQWHRGELRERTISPRAAGLEPVELAALAGDDPRENAEAMLRLFEGERGPYRTAVQLAGALALVAARDRELDDLAALAREIAAVLDDGRARSKLADLVAHSQNDGESAR
jgi:anthranilate phosphoribosyltransferase